MQSNELVSYIQEQTQQGISAQLLRESLLEAGWHETDIENALHDVAAGLHPATPGASIHEDLAQVRGMVAHLAARVRGIEAALSSVASLPMQRELSTQGALPAAPSRQWPGRLLAGMVGVASAVGAARFGANLVAHGSLMPRDAAIVASAIALVVLLGGLVAMRHRSAKMATCCTAGALMMGALVVWSAWREYAALEWTVALALGALLIVLAAVLGAWIDRFSR
ncbi:MAG: hypothetical protein IT406_02905 [Candidatus Yanofskybacteria bacterium]|nr:hypothetical protein [Candidatus Yanofskybacteria bacterium]